MATRQRTIGVAYEDAAIIGGSIDNSPIGATTPSTAVVTNFSQSGATSTTGFYGATPASQRASSVQAASVVSAASFISVSTNLCLFAAEVAATLTGLGLWKGTA